MFDKLIESNCEGADFKNRRSYFMVSSLVVGALFLTAVVISIFAADFRLGSTSFELTQMLSPVEMAATEPEPTRPRTPQTPSHSTSQLPIRQVNMQDVSQSQIVPSDVSVVKNTQQSRPQGQYKIGNFDSNPDVPNGSGRNITGPGTGGPTGLGTTTTVAETDPIPEPPPVKAPPVKKDIIRSIGVANGKATYLPKPPYPAAAIAVNARGAVDVQVMIDETGKVISAHAASGNPLLRLAAENAARNARFSPTLLSNVPVKVTGVIIYNFVR